MQRFPTLASIPNASSKAAAKARTDSAIPFARLERRRLAREVLQVFLDGATPRSDASLAVPTTPSLGVLRDLGEALGELSRAPEGKAIVRLYDEPWEMCMERYGESAALSVYRGGNDPTVSVYDRAVFFEDVVRSVADALARSVDGPLEGTLGTEWSKELHETVETLRHLDVAPSTETPILPAATPVVVELERDAPLSFGAEFSIRPRNVQQDEPAVERADLHSLLFRGRIRAEVRGRSLEFGEVHPFLVAERLLETVRRTLDAWERGQALHIRSDAGNLLVGMRLTSAGALSLTLGSPLASGQKDALFTFPSLSVADVLEAALAFSRSLVRGILRRDRTQYSNLRLSSFRRKVREASDALREVNRQDVKVNPSPEAYRSFAQPPRMPDAHAGLASSRLRYTLRWRAVVPGIDLRSTFLCGDRLIVGAAEETSAIDRTSGKVIWKLPTLRATSVVTPTGLARLRPDGNLRIHDYATGEPVLSTRVAPRLGGPPAGAIVHVPGLPKLLIVTEGERHLVAIDLTSGEARWRFVWGNRGTLRLKRAGKLLYVASGDSALTAVDVTTGGVIWRVRDRLRFRTAPTMVHDTLYAVAGGLNCAANLHCIDAFSGHVRWTRAIEGPAPACTLEGPPLATGQAVTVALRDRHGLRLQGFDPTTGEQRWSSSQALAPVGTSWLAIDDLFVGNTPTGDLLGVDAANGFVRYKHSLGRTLETDMPRKLEPVLRCGALFVPSSDVHVVRPRDGISLGSIAPCEAIADLLRVDERCDVYVAEESGHLLSFSAGPRLSLVPSG